MFPDGSFDGFVPVAPGPNTLAVRATLPDGSTARSQRVVHYEPPEAETPDSRREAEGVLLELRRRAREVDGSQAVEEEAGALEVSLPAPVPY
jgi:hypothetical protein